MAVSTIGAAGAASPAAAAEPSASNAEFAALFDAVSAGLPDEDSSQSNDVSTPEEPDSAPVPPDRGDAAIPLAPNIAIFPAIAKIADGMKEQPADIGDRLPAAAIASARADKTGRADTVPPTEAPADVIEAVTPRAGDPVAEPETTHREPPMPDGPVAAPPAQLVAARSIVPLTPVAHAAPQLRTLSLDVARSTVEIASALSDRHWHAGVPARFAVDAPELGGLSVEIAHADHRLSVTFISESQATRALLADAQPRLLADAQNAGLSLGQTNVADGRGSDRRPMPFHPTSRPAEPTGTPTPTTNDGRFA